VLAAVKAKPFGCLRQPWRRLRAAALTSRGSGRKDGLQAEQKDGTGKIVPSDETAGTVTGDSRNVIVRFQ